MQIGTLLNSSRDRIIGRVIRALAKATAVLDLPVVEKISDAQAEDPFRVLVATMLSAQTRDAVTHAASTRLFKIARTPKQVAGIPVRHIERLIYPVSFYRNKARHLRRTCEALLTRFDGRVPSTIDELLSLPGVGRKAANLVLIRAYGSLDNICVDTHVHRISNRLGWVRTRTPDETERALYRVTARRWWPHVNLCFVAWGQNVCRPVYPLCGTCVISRFCPRVGVMRAGKERTRPER